MRVDEYEWDVENMSPPGDEFNLAYGEFKPLRDAEYESLRKAFPDMTLLDMLDCMTSYPHFIGEEA